MENENYSIKKAVRLTAIAKYSTVLLQLLFSAILSRILTPDEYGTVAVVVVFITFFQLFSDMGFGVAVIQDKTLTNEETNGIYTFTIFMALLLMLGFCGFSFLIARFYEDDIYITLGMILSVSIFFFTLNTIPNAVLLKNKKFGTITMRTIVVNVSTSLITIVMASQGWGIYALVLQTVLSSIAIFVWNAINAKLSINLFVMMQSIKKVFSYSIFQFGAMTLNYFNRNLDTLLIGKIFDRERLGYYNKSYHLLIIPIHYIPGVLNPALQPIFSEYQNDKKYIYDKYVKILHILFFIGSLVAALCVANSKEIILLTYGNQWEDAVTPFRLLSISLGTQLLTNTIGSIFQSIGNTKQLFNTTILNTIIICGCIVTGAIMGDINYVALMVSVAYISTFFLSFYILVQKAFGYSFFSFLKSFKKDFLLYSTMIVIAFFLPSMVNSLFISFLIKTIILITIFVCWTYLNGSLISVIKIISPRCKI